jgi:hypothetical protein
MWNRPRLAVSRDRRGETLSWDQGSSSKQLGMFGKSGAFPFGGPGMFCRESEMGIASFDAAGGFGGFAFLPRPSFEIFYLVDKGHEISRMIC